jgi:hypothetical protein
MNSIKKILLSVLLALTIMPAFAQAELIFTPTGSRVDLDLQNGKNQGVNRTDYSESFVGSVESSMVGTFGNTFTYFRGSNTGEK